MKRICLGVLLAASAFASEQDGQKAWLEGDYKSAIRYYEKLPKESRIQEKLAELYFLDQNQNKSIEIFLDILNSPVNNPESVITPEEQPLYDAAYQKYSNNQSGPLPENLQEIIEAYAPQIKAHPDYTLLSYIVALAYANMGIFQEFYPLFYQAYIHHPRHYLVEKTKAILNLKLFESAAIPAEKAVYRERAAQHLKQAINLYPQDVTLYKMVIALSSEPEKGEVIEYAINQIISQDIAVPRHDILFYVAQAADAKLNLLAQKFIDKAKIWYPYSRAINNAQEYLDQKR